MNIAKVFTIAMLFSNIAYAQDDLPNAKSTLFSNVNLSVADYNNQPLVISASGIALKMRKFAVARDNLISYVSEDAIDATMGLMVLFLDMFAQHVNAECDSEFVKSYAKPGMTAPEICDAFKSAKSEDTIKLLEDALVFAEKGSSLAAAAGDVASMAEFDKWVRKLRAGGIEPSAWGKALDVVNQPNFGTTL